jgi:uncharacterized membrane protein
MTLTQFLLIIHILAVAYAMGIGMSNFLNMRVAKSQTGDIAKGLALHRISMLRYTDIAIAAILVTGLLMVWSMGGVPAAPPWFHVKMAAVVILVLAYGAMRYTVGQMLRTGNMALASRLEILSPILSLAAIATVICAVLAFKP